MQGLGAVTTENLLQRGQEPLLKLEIWVDPDWINICDLGGKNYLESISISHAGAGMSPNPIAATLSAEINNEGAIFHPKHPSSGYTDYFEAGRKVKISVGAKYGGTDYWWPRIIGHIDVPKFSGKTLKVSISGLDYTKTLADTKFRKTEVPPDNYWGDVVTKDSIATEAAFGDEIYVEEDAMDTDDAGHDNVDNWVPTGCTKDSIVDGTSPSNFVGEFTVDSGEVDPGAYATNGNVGAVEAEKRYRVTFYYRVVNAGDMTFELYEEGTSNKMAELTGLDQSSFTQKTLFFTATKSCNLKIRSYFNNLPGEPGIYRFRLDHISIREIIGTQNESYNMPAASKGVHYVELDYYDDGNWLPVWPGRQIKGDEGWFYNHDNNIFYFADGKQIEAGTANLKVYYYTATHPEDVVARILWFAGLYASEAAAKAAMEWDDPGFTVPQVWFDAGKSYLDAIKMLCERCDYRFYFKYDGTPVFKPVPSPKAPGNEDLDLEKQHISEPEYYEDRNEIRNRIVIEGLKQALPEGAEEAVPSELKGTAFNQPSIDAYGENTLSIKNHLFQDQTSIDDMCATLLARYKDPMWYFDFDTPFNPAPLEIWDTIKTELLLMTAAIPGLRYGSFKYDSGVHYGDADTAIDVRGLIRDIKIEKHNITYKCEEVT